MRGSKLRFWVLVLIFILMCFVIYRLLSVSTITITLKNDISALQINATVDGKVIAPIGKDGRTFPAKVGPGSHTVIVSSPGYENYTTKVSTSILSDKLLEVTLNPIPADKAAQTLFKGSDTKVSGAEYFGNNKDWMLLFASGSEGSIVVAKYNKTIRAWEIIDEGTDIETGQRIYASAPPDLLARLEQL